MRLLLDYPWYVALCCLLAGAAYAAVLYWPRKGRERVAESGRVLWLLAVLRALSVSLIAFLLTAPLVRRDVHETEKPIVAVVEDRSSSARECEAALPVKELERDYEVARYYFGSDVQLVEACTDSSLQALAKSTDIARALAEVVSRYEGRNLGAIVLSSDGIYNQGQNPATFAAGMTVPVYAVALGDTAHRRDASVAGARYNRIAYMGNRFPIEVTLKATRMRGEKAVLSILCDGRRLFSKEVAYTDNRFAASETVVLDAEKAGLHTYTIALSPCAGEATERNNSRTIAIEVIDGHQKIALIAAAPHPDISALRSALEGNPNYETDVFIGDAALSSARTPLTHYSLVILHNLPSSLPLGINGQLASLCDKVPTLCIVGSQTDLPRFNALHLGVEVVSRTRKTDEAAALTNSSFTLFTLDPDMGRRIEQLPPLCSPFGDYRAAAGVQALFRAKIGSVGSDRPLIAFGQQGGMRRGLVMGEGLWRWRLQSYQMTGSHDDFDQLVNKMAVYASLQVSKDRFRVVTESVYGENEQVVIGAELYNDNFEPVNTPDAVIALRHSAGTATEYPLNRTAGGYTLNVGVLEPGTYAYEARTRLAGIDYRSAGSFAVEEQHLEELNLVADHGLLNTIAQTTGGEMLLPDQAERLPQLLRERDDIKSVIYTRTRYTALLDLPLVFLLIVLLLGAEWAIRKYHGRI